MPYFKLTTLDGIHQGYKFQEGLNVDPTGYGFSYCCQEDICDWLYYNGMQMTHIWEVIIPENAIQTQGEFGTLTDRFILVNRKYVTEFLTSNLPTMLLSARRAVSKFPFIVYFLPTCLRTPEIHLLAVQGNWAILHDITPEDITVDMCLAALKQKKIVLSFVPSHLLPEVHARSKKM